MKLKYNNCSFLVNAGSDSDNQEAKPVLPQEEKAKKEMKKRETKDDTEQPIYPCEECTQCFTTISDLKVWINNF